MKPPIVYKIFVFLLFFVKKICYIIYIQFRNAVKKVEPKIRIYFADTLPLKNKAVYDRLYNSLTEERKAKANRYRFEKDKLLSVGAGVLLKKALSEAGIEEAEFGIGEKQKPYLKNHPGLFFNLSHSEEMVMCIVSDCEVGCDIEKIKESRTDVAERYFTAEENRAIKSAEDKKEMFFRIWTLKESYIKALGLGLSLSLKDFSISLGDKIQVTCNGVKADYSFSEFRGISGYCCSCCVKGNFDELLPMVENVDLGTLI